MSESIGDKIAAIRKSKSISQRELAKLSGVSNSTISRIESGIVKPDFDTIEKITNVIKSDMTSIFNLSKLKQAEIVMDIIKNICTTTKCRECPFGELYDDCTNCMLRIYSFAEVRAVVKKRVREEKENDE